MRQMEQPRPRTCAAGPRRRRRPASIISTMKTTTPIRRYVLLRHRDRSAPASRWSLERIGAEARQAGDAGTGTAGVRATLSASTSR